MFTKIFGVAFVVLTGLQLLGIAGLGNTIMGLLALALAFAWAIAWIANA